MLFPQNNAVTHIDPVLRSNAPGPFNKKPIVLTIALLDARLINFTNFISLTEVVRLTAGYYSVALVTFFAFAFK